MKDDDEVTPQEVAILMRPWIDTMRSLGWSDEKIARRIETVANRCGIRLRVRIEKNQAS